MILRRMDDSTNTDANVEVHKSEKFSLSPPPYMLINAAFAANRLNESERRIWSSLELLELA